MNAFWRANWRKLLAAALAAWGASFIGSYASEALRYATRTQFDSAYPPDGSTIGLGVFLVLAAALVWRWASPGKPSAVPSAPEPQKASPGVPEAP